MPATQIVQRQIADGAINNAKIAAGAAIATNKLADGSNFLQRDGSVALTGNLDAGSQRIINVSNGIGSNDAVNKSQLDSAIAGINSLFSSKGTVRAATTSSITVSNPGTSSFDGVTLSSGDRLLLRAQSSSAENGVYVFNGSGSALTRSSDMDAWAEIPGALVIVAEGSTYADSIWLCTSNQGGTLGSTSITWQQLNITGGGGATFVDKETPTGSINGSNTTFTLSFTPISGSEHVYLNGLLQESGAGNDYTISSGTITMLTAPISGDKIRVSYRR